VHRHGDMLVTSRGFARGVLDLREEDVMFSVSKLFLLTAWETECIFRYPPVHRRS